MIFYQLLPTTSVGNEWGQQLRIQILMLGIKGLINRGLPLDWWLLNGAKGGSTVFHTCI